MQLYIGKYIKKQHQDQDVNMSGIKLWRRVKEGWIMGWIIRLYSLNISQDILQTIKKQKQKFIGQLQT